MFYKIFSEFYDEKGGEISIGVEYVSVRWELGISYKRRTFSNH